jgi:DNA-binding IclR family transcriptional regulator
MDRLLPLPDKREGTQSIERALRVIRMLASTNYSRGIGFDDLIEHTDLRKSTLHRILGLLMRERFVERDPISRMYFLGMGFLELGAASLNRVNLREIARPRLQRVAEETNDTAYLSVRSGCDAICIDRQEGAFPIKAITLNIGDRRPLGVGAGSLALLAWLPRLEIESIVARNARRFPRNPALNPKDLIALVETCLADGHSFNDGRVLRSMCAIGVPVLARDGAIVAAISVAATADRMGGTRRARLARMLQEEAHILSTMFEARGALEAT